MVIDCILRTHVRVASTDLQGCRPGLPFFTYIVLIPDPVYIIPTTSEQCSRHIQLVRTVGTPAVQHTPLVARAVEVRPSHQAVDTCSELPWHVQLAVDVAAPAGEGTTTARAGGVGGGGQPLDAVLQLLRHQGGLAVHDVRLVRVVVVAVDDVAPALQAHEGTGADVLAAYLQDGDFVGEWRGVQLSVEVVAPAFHGRFGGGGIGCINIGDEVVGWVVRV